MPSVTSDVVGEGIIQDIVQEWTNITILQAMGISQDDLKVIQEDIAVTIHPYWHAAPLANLGHVSHSKLKADEWRSCFNFDVPVSLLYIETQRSASGKQVDEYHAKLVHSTFLLSIAIQQCMWKSTQRQ
jgi:hypothetical protein